MAANRLKEFLDGHAVRYVAITHSRAYTAQEIAASAHIPGDRLAKTVMVRLDGKMAMAVLPASAKLDLERLKQAAGVKAAEIAAEPQFRDRFPDCEVGAMPPFGNLYGMDVFADQRLRADEIAFNSGTHTELIRMSYEDFEKLVQPKVAELAS
jgi:Ala-tRNA(Pro) deacylase